MNSPMPLGDWLPHDVIGKQIRRMRRDFGDTQAQFLERAGLPPTMQADLSKQENGHERLGEGALEKIAALAGGAVEMFKSDLRPEVVRDQHLVNRLLSRVDRMSTREAEAETGINYSVIHGWRREPLKGTLRQETRAAVLAYLGEGDVDNMGYGYPSDAQHMGQDVNSSAALILERRQLLDYLERESRAAELRAREAIAAELRARVMAQLVGASVKLLPEHFPGGIEAPEIEVREERPTAVRQAGEDPAR